MGKPIRKRFDINVLTEFQKITQTFNLDKNIKYIKGLLISGNRDDLIYFRGTQRIEINGEEYFPENYQSRLLMAGLNMAPHNRFYDLGSVPSGNGVIKVTFQDEDSRLTSFEPYRVSLYILAELDDETR